eukprot:887953-Prorocentrum_minimum.AAC.2
MDAKGVRMDAKGVRMDAKGVHIDAKGLRMDAKGVHMDTKGVHMDAKGVHMDAKGVHMDAKGVGAHHEVGREQLGGARQAVQQRGQHAVTPLLAAQRGLEQHQRRARGVPHLPRGG